MIRKKPQVFKNWFTRNGKRIKTRGWCVRIQHEGIRRTISLQAGNRNAATQEAEVLLRKIHSDGWPDADGVRGVISAPENATADTQGKNSAIYWKQYLVFRKYKGGAQYAKYPVYSVRMEHEGNAFYFPLGVDQADQAASKAVEIHGEILKRGWRHVMEKYPYEFTVAVQWAPSPFCCTYTTMYSLLVDMPKTHVGETGQNSKKQVAIIEPNPVLRYAMRDCVDQHVEFACNQHYGDFKSAVEHMDTKFTDIVLLNRDLPEALTGQATSRINRIIPRIPVWTYGIYEDSDQIFVSVTGVMAGYIMRRRHHNALLEPIFGASRLQQFTARDAYQKIRDYFQSLFTDSSPMATAEENARFSVRELEIIKYLRKGFIDKEIASSSGISVWTVRKHLHNIYRKLNVTTRTEAVIRLISK